MAKGCRLSEFEKDKITAVKSVGKFLRDIPKTLGCSKTLICNSLKNRNNYGKRKLTSTPEK